MFSFYDFVSFVSEVLRMFGLLIAGVAVGWFTVYAFFNRPWQVQVAVILSGFLLLAVIASSVTGSSTGSFAAGFGGALLVWGLLTSKSGDDDEPPAGED